MGKVADFFAHGFNAFNSPSREPEYNDFASSLTHMVSYPSRPDRVRLMRSGGEKTIIASIYNRLAIDASSFMFRHVQLDDNERILKTMDSKLNECFTLKANKDQAARAFRQDIYQTMFEKGDIAIVATDTTEDPSATDSYDVEGMRVGTVVKWYPHNVKVRLYNENTGRQEEITLPKSQVALAENPFFTVMNEPNSTLQRLIRKLSLLDMVDEASSSGKLDLIVQLPYMIKGDVKKAQAEQRRSDIEWQLKGSQYGIAYMDGTEKITQLNRPAENNLLKQIEALLQMLYGELGLTPEIMNGTADEAAMLNYYHRTIEPIVDAVAEPMRSTFLTKTARTQKKTIDYFRDPFKLVPIEKIVEFADKLARNEILSSNELRGIIGFKPSKDPKADELRNSNMPAPSEPASQVAETEQEGDRQNGSS